MCYLLLGNLCNQMEKMGENNAIEILKLRGAAHQKKIVAMQITDQGIVVYSEQEVFSEID